MNGVSANPARWPDGTYSVQGAAVALGITPQTIFDYLARGWFKGHQLVKGQPWRIDLSATRLKSAGADRTQETIEEGGIMKSLGIQLTPTPSSIVSFTTPTVST